MPTKTNPDTQRRALLVRDAVAVLGIEYPQPEDDRFRQSLLLRLAEEIGELEPQHLTRLHEASCKADIKHAGVADFRTVVRTALGRAYDLAGARKRARQQSAT